MKREKKAVLKFGIFFVLAVALFIVLKTTDLGPYLNPERIRDFILSFGIWSAVVYFFLYVLAPLFLLPASLLSLAGGLAFGPLWGTVLTLVGATAGASLAFLLARKMGRDFVGKLFKGKLKSMDARVEKHGFTFMLFFRLVPIFPFGGLNYACGLSKMKFRDYFFGTLIGMVPGTFAYVYLGSSLMAIHSGKFFLAVFIFLIVMIIPLIYKKRKANKERALSDKRKKTPDNKL